MISVIVPVYNGSAYIERCINSITGSTFRDIEIIAVENGSTDNTWEILEALAAGDSRIKPISTEIRGLSNARNIGIDHASGDWIAFVDADDYISPLMYERLAEAAQTHGADLVLCDFAQGTEEHFRLYGGKLPGRGLQRGGGTDKGRLLPENIPSGAVQIQRGMEQAVSPGNDGEHSIQPEPALH